MLEKEVSQRYASALAIIEDLGFPLHIDITKEFLPAKIYSYRDSDINQISSYINEKESTEVFTIKGFEGVGKSSLLNKIKEDFTHAVKISEVKGKSVQEIIRHFLRQIIFSESVFPNLSGKDRSYLFEQLAISQNDITNEFRNCISIISSSSKFILLIDDLNLYDQLTSNMLLDIIPILQVNNTKVILSESSEREFISLKINNLKEISLGAFVERELKTFLEDSFYSDFPNKTIQNLIIKNADLIPGNIKSFIKDLILFGIMKFTSTGIKFLDEEDKLSSISEAHFAVYDLRLANLTKRELIASQIISAFEVYIDSYTLSLVLGLNKTEIDSMIVNLQFNNIIRKFISGDALIFTSEALKNYIYSSVENKKKLHQNIAINLSKKLSGFNRVEMARQYELAGEYEKCYTITMEELNEAEKHSAFSYIQKLLSHLITLPLKKEILESTKVKLSEIYLKLGDVQSSLALVKELKSGTPQAKIDAKLFTIEGSALIASGEYEAGRRVISELLKKIKDTDEKNRLKVELAYADFELKIYNEANQQCEELLEERNLSAELKGRCYNLKGMINIYQSNDLKSALENFEKAKNQFSEAGQPIRVSGTEVNIGNIYNIFGNHKKAEEHLQNASRINQSIGNLDQEGLLMQNMGIFYFDRRKIDYAIQSYHKAIKIFVSLGNDFNRGLVLWDLGEIHIASCEYDNALESLIEAQNIFRKLNNHVELLDVFFLKAKLFYKIGALQKFEETFEEFQTHYSDHDLIESHQIYQKLLVQLKSFYMDKTFSLDEIDFIRKEMAQRRDNHNLIDISFFLIQYFINEQWYQKASQELYNQELIDLCSQNFILEAEREYFLGIISKNSKSDKLLSPLIYFEKAYDLIKDQYINELTWKVLFEISELYIERGNLHKAKYFVTYTRELIYFIAEKIKSPQLRAAYLRNSERLNTLKKLESFYPSS
jgi:tetratricopeptide (TPR) repeat protein